MNLTCPPQNPEFYVGLPPKNGSSSVRHWMWERERGRPWDFERDGSPWQYFRNHCEVNTKDLDTLRAPKIAMTRDPVERVVSCYANKYLQEGWGVKNVGDNLTFSQFWPLVKSGGIASVDRRYTFHVFPQTHFLGARWELYQLVIPFRHIREFHKIIATVTGKDEAPLPHHMKTDSQAVTPTPEEVREIKLHYAKDYDAGWDGEFSEGYDPDSL